MPRRRLNHSEVSAINGANVAALPKRKLPRQILGVDTFVISAEDLLLVKLEWYRDSESERHLRDAVGIIRRQENQLDQGYIDSWCARLSLQEQWGKAIEKALEQPNTDVRIFGKPTTRPYRRMGVAIVYDNIDGDMNALRRKAKAAADCIRIV